MFSDRTFKPLDLHPQQTRCLSGANPSIHAPTTRRDQGNDAASGIDRAYDGLHRIHAILAYLNLTKQHVPGVSEFLDEAKHTYQQSLARYEAHDFEGAWEFASASRCLSRLVDIVIFRTLRSDTSYASLVPPPPEHNTSSSNPSRVQNRLAGIESTLARLHWLLKNGTLPLEDRTQVRRITSWGDAFYQLTRRMYRSGSMEEASDLAQAAASAAHSAEHICRNWYVALPGN